MKNAGKQISPVKRNSRISRKTQQFAYSLVCSSIISHSCLAAETKQLVFTELFAPSFTFSWLFTNGGQGGDSGALGGAGGAGGAGAVNGTNGGAGGTLSVDDGADGANGGGFGGQGSAVGALGGGGVDGGGAGGDGGATGGGGGGGGGVAISGANTGAGTGGGGGGGSAGGSGGGGGGGGSAGVVVNLSGDIGLLNVGSNGGQGGAAGTTEGSGGGGGGGGSAAVLTDGTQTYQSSGSNVGGAGGDGGNAVVLAGGGGGGGGAGGHGIFLTNGGALTHNGVTQGGAGGSGGDVGGVGLNSIAGVGGLGGTGILLQAAGILTNSSGQIFGGSGGNGGSALIGSDKFGGNAGAGGNGVFIANGTFTNCGLIIAGNGGNGGDSTAGASTGGNGGDGGTGVFVASGGVVNNCGSIVGGDGGSGGSGILFPGIIGASGDAISGQNLTIVNTGLIAGGRDGNGVQGNAITFTGGINRLELWAPSFIVGNVLAATAADTLALSGPADGSFDLGLLGTQYQGFGVFEKTGLSVWTVTGIDTQSSNWSVNQGTFVVQGTIGGLVLVNSGGRLQGTGTVGAAIINGIIAPGNSIGTINVNGNFVQNPGSIYQVEINPLGESDLINVSDFAILNGGLVQVIREPGSYIGPIRYTILTAGSGVSGTYDGVVQDFPFLSLILSYDSNNVFLDLLRNSVSFPSVAVTPNQIATATGIESLGAGNEVFDAIVGLNTVSDAQQAFDLLSGEEHASALAVLIEESRYLRDATLNRLDQALLSPSYAVINKFTATNTIQSPSDWTFWGQAFGAWGDIKGDGNAAGVDRRSSGFFLGSDKAIGQKARVGLVGGYTRSHFDVDARNSDATSDNYHVGIYGGTQFNQLGLRVGGAYTWHDIDMSRNIVFPGFANFITSNYNAHTAQVFGEAGYDLSFKRIFFEPFAGLAYVDVENQQWRESGGSAALAGKGSENVGYATLGAREASELFQAGQYQVSQRVLLAWRHAFDNLTPQTTLAFASGSVPFLISGTPIAENSFLIDLGLNVLDPTNNLNIRFSYIGQFANQVEDNGVAAVFSWKFA